MLKSVLPQLKASLSNSAAIALSDEYHFDLVRPGIGLYGGQVHQMEVVPVVSLNLPVIQIKRVEKDEVVGYGATHKVVADAATLAIVAGGYADGVLRSLSNRGRGFIGGVEVPIVGRVSMDTCVFDVSAVSPKILSRPGLYVELLGSHHSIDALAAEAQTIAYEVLTSLGARYHRCYVG